MSSISRRRMITATSATGLTGVALAAGPTPALAATAGAVELITPYRLQDSRTMEPDKYDTTARDTLAVDGLAGKSGVILNVTVTQTEGSGFFRVAGEFQDPPTTSSWLPWPLVKRALSSLAT